MASVIFDNASFHFFLNPLLEKNVSPSDKKLCQFLKKKLVAEKS